MDSGESAQRHRHGLRGAGGAGGEDLDQCAVAADRDRARQRVRFVQQRLERQIAAGRLAGGHDDPRRVGGQVVARVEFRPLTRVDDDHAGPVADDPLSDRGRRERGEQRHVDRAEPPDREQCGDQFGGLAHERRDPVAGPHAVRGQRGGEPGGSGLEPAVREVAAAEVGLDERERDGVGRMPSAQQLGRVRVRRGVGLQQVEHGAFRAHGAAPRSSSAGVGTSSPQVSQPATPEQGWPRHPQAPSCGGTLTRRFDPYAATTAARLGRITPPAGASRAAEVGCLP